MSQSDVDAWALKGSQSLLNDTAQQVRNSVGPALAVNPDQEAQTRRYAAAAGVPLDTARNLPAVVKTQAQMSNFNADSLAAKFPNTAQWLTNPDNAKLAHDDIPGTANVEQHVKALAVPPPAAYPWSTQTASPDAPSLMDRMGDWARGLVGMGPAQHTADPATQARATIDLMAKRAGLSRGDYIDAAGGSSAGIQVRDWSRQFVSGAVDSATAGLAPAVAGAPDTDGTGVAKGAGQLAGFLIGAPLAIGKAVVSKTVGGVLSHVAGESFLKAIAKDTASQAATLGIASGVQAVGSALEQSTATDAAMTIGRASLSGAMVGGVFGVAGRVLPDSTILQGALRFMGVSAALDAANGTSPTDNRPIEQKVFDYGMNAFFTAHGAGRTGGRWLTDMSTDEFTKARDAAMAEVQTQRLVDLSAASVASKLRERDPEAFKAFVKTAAEQGDMHGIYIEGTKLAEILQQGGIGADELAQKMPEVAAQMPAALGENAPRNGLVKIPVEDFATHIAGSTLEQPLMDNLRLSPEGKTNAEGEAFLKGQTEGWQAQADKIVAAHGTDTAYQASVDQVRADIQGRLEANGMRPDIAATNAAPLAAFYQVHADRLGILPHEFAERYPVRFGNEALAGLNQGAPTLDSVKQTWDAAGIKHSLSEKDGVISLDRIIVPKEGRGAGAGTEAMKSLLAYAEATGQRVELTPSTDFGASSRARLVAFYKGFGFVENKGRAKDFTTRAGMIRSPEVLNQAARGTFSPDSKTISILKSADLSTFQHELAHYFLDTMAHMAAMPDAPASVKSDMATVLKWFGLTDVDSWHQMSLDEQRVHHEKFATGWETYLMKGDAPTLEMRGMFSRFRSWMINVYQSLKGAPGEYTPEVRGVFDRMIASEEAIHQAELARRYMPLFDSPEKAGMSPEEWAAYQAQGRDATEVAIEGLIGKTMKDMVWSDNLRTRSLKSVQKDAAEKRKVVQREVRREVMSQPVYRAWSFLTGKGEKDQRATPDKNPNNPDVLDPTRDSLFAAIAKFGGVNKADAVKSWGIDPKGGYESGVFGKPVLRAEGGLSVEAMAERLAEEFYVRTDDRGSHDSRDFEDRFNAESAGDTQFSYKKDMRGEELTPIDLQSNFFGKFSTEALRERFGTGENAIWRKLSKQRMTSDQRGLDPDVVADAFGYESGNELVKALADAPHPREVVGALTDQRMLERHGEIANPEAMARTADELVHNEVRARFVATELRALKKAIGTAKDMALAAKEVAAKTIDTKRVRDITAGPFDAAETRSAGEAERAIMKGDTEGAAAAKRDQLLNLELARAARNALDYVSKSLAYLAKFDRASVRENIDVDYRDQIDALLDRADLRKSVSGKALDKREALAEFVERMAGNGLKPQIPEALLNELQRWHYKDMPLDAFRGLVDSVKSIEHLGKLKNELRDGQETRKIGDLADEVAASAAQLPQRTPESNRGLTRMESAWIKTKSYGRSAEAALLKMEQMFDWLDRRKSNGVLNRVVFRRLSEAGIHENNLLATVKAEIDKLLHANLADVTKEKGAIYTAAELVDAATGKPQKFTVKEMLMLAGNMGNESNAGKMAKGEGWDQTHVWNFLNKNMTKAHWDYVAGMGRTLESLWPEKMAMDRRLGNTTPEKIAPRPFDTPHGRYEGWYWPLMYDPARSQDVAERGAKQGDALFENSYAKANTDTGRMNTRSEGYARPLLLDLDALPRMIKDEIHDVSHREAVIDSDRFLAHPVVRQAIIEALSQEHYDQIRPWLQSIANDGKMSTDGARGMEFFNSIAKFARTRATMVGLGFRLTTAMVHGMSAGAESVAELGGKWMLSGIKDFVNPGQWSANKDFIFERSGEMRNRMNEVDRDVREHLRDIDTHLMDPTTGAVARGADIMRAHAYTMIAGLDMMSALPTWMGAYKKGLSPVERGGLGFSETDAVYFADKTVRNAHGGTGIKDQARIQRGSEFQKLFTMFYTFWNHNINRIVDTAKLATSPEHRAAMKEANHWSDTQVAATVIMRTLVYTLGVQVLHSLVHPPKEGEGDESWLKWAGKEFTAAAFGGIPIARDIVASALTGRDYKTTPAASIVTAAGQSGVDSLHALTGQQVSDKWLKHTITTAGYVFNLPTGQLASGVQFMWDVGNGQQHPENASDWWNGVLHGDMKHH